MLAAGTRWKLFDLVGGGGGAFLNFNWVLPGNETVIFLAFFCSIQCKFY